MSMAGPIEDPLAVVAVNRRRPHIGQDRDRLTERQPIRTTRLHTH